MAALKKTDWRTRQRAVSALGIIGSTTSIEALLDVLNDPRQEVRLETVKSLGKFVDPRILESLIPLMADKSWRIRLKTIKVLETAGDQRLLEPMTSAVMDECREVRLKAISALGNIADLPLKTIEVLITALIDNDQDISFEALRVLEEVGSPLVVPLVDYFERNWQSLNRDMIRTFLTLLVSNTMTGEQLTPIEAFLTASILTGTDDITKAISKKLLARLKQ
ncbi:MAG: HEAT repeat domain-containing protein [Candidatus Odinarchaeota archaeon]